MSRRWRTAPYVALGLALGLAGCGEREQPDMPEVAEIGVDSPGVQGLSSTGAVADVVALLRGEPGRTIYIPPPDLGRPPPGAAAPGPSQRAVEEAPPPPDTAGPGQRDPDAPTRPDTAVQDTAPPDTAPPDTAPPDTALLDAPRRAPLGRAGGT